MYLRLMAVLTLLLSGRAMTLAFLGRVGGGQVGDPPEAWLMPLLGDAVIGVTALLALFLILRGRGLWAWLLILTWNALAIWDALSAFIISVTNPWPEFFMLQLFGPSMFFVASLLHLVIIVMALRPEVMAHFGVSQTRLNGAI